MNQEMINKINKSIFFLMAISVVFYRFTAVQSILMILSAVFVTFNIIKVKKHIAQLPFLIMFLILTTVYLFYFDKQSLKKIGEAYLIFIAPLLLVFNQDELYEKFKNKILSVYSICTSFLALFIIYFYIKDIPNHKLDWYWAREHIEIFMKIHSTYTALWLGVSILFLIHFLTNQKTILVQKLIIVWSILVQISVLVILNTRMALYSLIFILLLNAILFTKNKQRVIVLSIVFVFALSVGVFTDRYKKDTQFLIYNSLKNSPRYPMFYAATTLIEESPLIGYNPAKIQNELDKKYKTHFPNNELLFIKSRNCHNQYFQYFLEGGVLLFFLFISTLLLKLFFAIKSNDKLYFSITLFFVFSFFTENVLVRQYGIFIFFFVDFVFLSSVLQVSNEKS